MYGKDLIGTSPFVFSKGTVGYLDYQSGKSHKIPTPEEGMSSYPVPRVNP